MHKHKMRPMERSVLAGLRRNHADAPDEVLVKEARFRLCAKALDLNEGGMTQEAVAAKFGYTVDHLQRSTVRVPRHNREQRNVSPLTAWQDRRIEQTLKDVKAAYDAEQTPAPSPEEAIEPEITHEAVMAALDAELTDSDNVVTIGIDTQPPMSACAVAWTGTDGSRSWILRLDGNGLSLAGVPPTPEPDPALIARFEERGPMLGAAVRLLQLAAGIPGTGTVDDETTWLVAGLAAWQSRPRPLMDAVERFVDGRRRA